VYIDDICIIQEVCSTHNNGKLTKEMFHKVLKTNELTVEREKNPQIVGPKENYTW
jgi:hypothetical protein